MPRVIPDAARVIAWTAATCENLAAPDKATALLTRAVAAQPNSPAARRKLGNLYLDGFDFSAAAAQFEAALRVEPASADTRIRLARCHNVQRRFDEALAVLGDAATAEAHFQRGMALFGLDRAAGSEAEFRAALAADPHHRRACMKLCQFLRPHPADLVAFCEDLAGRGANHAQLFLDWGRALALAGDTARARRLLFDPTRLFATAPALPPGFNAALAAELLTNPFPLSDFPTDEEANRGSRRVHNLLSGRDPKLIRTLIRTLQGEVDALAATLAPRPGFDPWPAARPASAHIRPWGLLQQGGEYEEWHTHRGGWLSGVYYARVPPSVSAEGEGHGCIEFGPPRSFRETMPDLAPMQRIAPREGLLLLAPSHYHHHTIPTGVGEPRISFAFDVVADA
jgi:tetratricopeptide (TPR) repeat protein